MIYKIIINDKCNLKCEYCNLDTSKENIITYERLDSIFNYIESNLFKARNNKDRVDLFGGEPFLTPDIIKYCIEKTKQLDIKLYIPTNGTIPINKEIYDNCNISISYDGLWQDSRIKNNKYNDIILKNIKNIKNIHCVVDPISLKKSTLLENDIYLKTFSSKVTYGLNKDYVWTRETVELFKKQLKEIFNYYIPLLKEKQIYSFLVPYIGTLFAKDSSRNCGIMKESITFNQEGNIIPCERFDKEFVNIEKIIDTQLKECSGCSISNYCPKGCVHNRILFKPDLLCEVYKEIYRYSQKYIKQIISIDKILLNQVI